MNENRVNAVDKVNEKHLLRWQRRNAYYYRWLNGIYKHIVRPNSRVLHVGCECGDLLEAVEPAYGVGVDIDPEAVELAKQRFPHLTFYTKDPHELNLDETFDYILICNSIGSWHDIQRIMEQIRPLAKESCRVIITYYNYLWEGILRLGSLIHLRRPYLYQNWLSSQDITNLLNLTDFDVIRKDSYVLLPKRIPPLTTIANYFLSLLPGLRYLNLINVVIARPVPTPVLEKNLSVSVIVPCKNERGNIRDAIKRIPIMGRETEIIFVDGNSTDGTCSEIEVQIQENPERKICLLHQGNRVGKGDAVRKGFAEATGDVLVIQDADLTAPPEDLPKFFKALCSGKGEFINGSRLVYPLEKQSMRFLNLLGNKFFGALLSWLLGQRLKDTLCGTKMIRRIDYERIKANRSYFGDFDPFGDFDLIFGAVKQNLKVVEVPIRYGARTYGKTNIDRFKHGWFLLKMSWVAFKKIKWFGEVG